eukprot:GILJ01005495.1.p1 GENE.GILJ01005495.1~~GILJ01005495.1.p1  ORF type:complete len:148 (-),score=22.07 GILJ01005495.1:136-579(-)
MEDNVESPFSLENLPEHLRQLLEQESKHPSQPISFERIQMVQGLIEECLKQYMNLTEIIAVLHLKANVESSFTSLVLQKLEEQNKPFFTAYRARAKLKSQILEFNQLIEQDMQRGQLHGLPENSKDNVDVASLDTMMASQNITEPNS